MKLHFDRHTIVISNDPEYTSGSADNLNRYAHEYCSCAGNDRPSSQHGVRIYDNGKETSSCILLGSGGATGIHDSSALIDGNKLLVCCGDSVFCLALPELNLRWITKADDITCFQVFKPAADCIVHGELNITGLTNEGKIKWQFSGQDIFVTIDDTESFKLEHDHIVLTDFQGFIYKIDFYGKEITL